MKFKIKVTVLYKNLKTPSIEKKLQIPIYILN